MTMRKRSIILSVGSSCFTVCHGCYNYFSSSRNLVPVSDILYLVEYAKEKYDIHKVTVAGGDPLSRPDIIELLTSLKDHEFSINLDTVGTAFLKDAQLTMFGTNLIKKVDIREMVRLVDILGIPLDGSRQDVCEQFRKTRPFLFEETLSILGLAEKNKLRVSINTVVHKGNIFDLPKIFDILSNYKNIFRWQLFQFMPIGIIGNLNKEKYLITDQEFQNAFSLLNNKRAISKLLLDPKSCSYRKNVYIMVDSNGLAWSPKSSTNSKKWNSQIDDNGERIIWGNIRDKNDVPNILESAFSYV